jgi:tRNA(Phe) wybutosine-synthesizing methylase Tyw3
MKKGTGNTRTTGRKLSTPDQSKKGREGLNKLARDIASGQSRQVDEGIIPLLEAGFLSSTGEF